MSFRWLVRLSIELCKRNGSRCLHHFNFATEEYYIGCSGQIESQWSNHQSRLKDGKHHNSRLQEAWDSYGAETFDCFTLEVLDLVEISEFRLKSRLLSAEARWIEKLQPDHNIDLSERMIEVWSDRKKLNELPQQAKPKSTQRKARPVMESSTLSPERKTQLPTCKDVLAKLKNRAIAKWGARGWKVKLIEEYIRLAKMEDLGGDATVTN